MANKRILDLGRCAAIVESTLKGRIGQLHDLSPAARLGDLLLTLDERTWFQQAVHVRVESEGFTIKLGDIPIDPNFTIGDIAKTLTGLSGKTHRR